MDTDPRRWIAALRISQNRLASLVRPLTAEQLRQPSYHSWTIAEVLAHMGSQAEIFMGWVQSALDSTAPAGRESMQPIWDAWNSRSPDEQAPDSLDVNEILVQRFEGLTDDQLKRMHLNLFGMELDGTGLPRLRLTEHALHTWDIDVGLNPTAQVPPEAVALLIDTLGPLAARVANPQKKGLHLRIRTTEPPRDFLLQTGDPVQIGEWQGYSPDAEMNLPAEAFVRLVYGRLDPDHAPEIGLTGPITIDDLRKIFPGV